jgi:4-amino-4-deoxy-L-arabinose transferase-like glycosyltransferase
LGAVTARWPRLALAALLAFTAVLYLWNLSASGYGNTFYAAAAQSGAQSWPAYFFGSLDAHDFITVDKPPGALWITGMSVRLFGMTSLSVLGPQAVMGVTAVAVLFAAVRRSIPDPTHAAAAGLLAGAALACTPAAALMFRFNNPDALLVLLLTIAAYCATRAVQAASWRWLLVVGAVTGAAFLTKMMQAFLVLPGFAAAYLLLAQTRWCSRLLHLAAATGVLVASAGWWVLIVQLIPARSRPYVGGSTHDSVLDLAFGYNGISRIVGTERGPESPRVAAAFKPPNAINTSTGLHRLFTSEMANEISWLLPVALFAIAFGVYSWARGRLSHDERTALVIWGGWLLVTGAVFSFMHGTMHPYYTVALAPAVGALVGLGAVWGWRNRATIDGRIGLAGMVVIAGCWSAILLHRNHFGPHWLPWAVVSVSGCAAAILISPKPTFRRENRGFSRRNVGLGETVAAVGLAIGAATAMAGTVAFAIATAASPHHGTIPIAVGKWSGDPSTDIALGELLAATNTPWSAATNGSQSAANLEIASRTSVMAIGGWSGDPVPTLDQFVEDVHAGKIAYYVESGKGGADQPHGRVIRAENHGVSHTREIADWVAAHYPAIAMGDSLVYRLT